MKISRLKNAEGDWGEYSILCSEKEFETLGACLFGAGTAFGLTNLLESMLDEMEKFLEDQYEPR